MSTKIRYAFQKVMKYITQKDPMGLIQLGFPTTEYDLEIPDIIKAIKQSSSWVQLRHKLQQIFEYWFFRNCLTIRTCETMAKDLWQLKENGVV